MENKMPTAHVKFKYSATGGHPTTLSSTDVHVTSNPATESEVSAALKKKYPKYNFIITEIKTR